MSTFSTQIVASKYNFPLKEKRIPGKIFNLGLEQKMFHRGPEKLDSIAIFYDIQNK